ncbi:MAG: hypothetical protein RIF41_05825 [Polyangiaceae bacterium]
MVIETPLRFVTLRERPASTKQPTIVVDVVPASDESGRGDETLLWTSPAKTDVPFVEASRHGSGLRMRFLDLGHFDVTPDGLAIRCHSRPGVALASLEQLLVDQVLPRALHLAGRTCLHGSAVRLDDGRALAFVGPSGIGKSTLAAHLCERGAALLCDDALALEVSAEAIVVHPAYASVRLWPDSAKALAGGTELPVAAPHTDKRRLPRRATSSPAPLDTLWLLSRSERPATARAISPQETIAELARHTHRLDAEATEAMRAEFNLLTAIVARVKVKRLPLPDGYDALDAVVARLIDELE